MTKKHDLTDPQHPYHHAPRGMWLGAGLVLGRPVPVAEPYPHICHHFMTGAVSGVRFKTTGRDCAACVEIKNATKENE